MNRRELMKGAAASALVVGAAAISTCASNRQKPQSGARPGVSPQCTSEIDPTKSFRVVFHGLWVFWVGISNGGKPGVLAFTPIMPEHVQTASVWGAAEIATLDGFFYTVDVVANNTVTASDLGRRMRAHDAGIQIPSKLFDESRLRTVFDERKFRSSAALYRAIWLPLPDDILPIVHSDITGVFQGDDIKNQVVSLGSRYPGVQLFCYTVANGARLNGPGIPPEFEAMSGQNLHFHTIPPISSLCDKGEHARHAIDKAMSLITKSDGHPVDVHLSDPAVSHDVTICDPTSLGLEAAEVPKPIVCHRVAPSNCAGGNGFEILP